LALALDDRGWSALAPDLRDSLSSLPTFSEAASRAVNGIDVVVGHSGAGAALPVIAHRLNAAVMVFVDAVVPEAAPTFTPSAGFAAFVDQLPLLDGLLPPWHQWWPPEVLARLLPDEQVGAAVVAENPRLARAFYDEPVALPDLWWQRPAAFLELSPAYDEDRGRAEGWGWPTCHLEGQHLDLLTRPSVVADAVVRLTATVQLPNR
jgi:hypothetical protein